MLQTFIEKPTTLNWSAIKSEIKEMLENIEKMTSNLHTAVPAIATTDFYPVLVGTLIERKSILTKLLNSAQPTTDEDIEAIKTFLTHYDRLIDELIKVPSRSWLELGWRSLRGVQPRITRR